MPRDAGPKSTTPLKAKCNREVTALPNVCFRRQTRQGIRVCPTSANDTKQSFAGSKAPFFTLAKRFLRPELVVRLCQYFKASHSARSGFDRAASAGRSVNCAAVENTRERIRTVTTRPVMPEAVRIIATTMN